MSPGFAKVAACLGHPEEAILKESRKRIGRIIMRFAKSILFGCLAFKKPSKSSQSPEQTDNY